VKKDSKTVNADKLEVSVEENVFVEEDKLEGQELTHGVANENN